MKRAHRLKGYDPATEATASHLRGELSIMSAHVNDGVDARLSKEIGDISLFKPGEPAAQGVPRRKWNENPNFPLKFPKKIHVAPQNIIHQKNLPQST